VARYDKYDPMAGGFRAPLAAAWLLADVARPIGIGLNASGQVVKGAAQSGIVGVLILTKVRPAGYIVDTMTAGEIIEWDPVTAGTAGTAGTIYYADPTTGVINSTLADGKTRVGHTSEGTRLICRVVVPAMVVA
jgi:hypothetical protein